MLVMASDPTMDTFLFLGGFMVALKVIFLVFAPNSSAIQGLKNSCNDRR